MTAQAKVIPFAFETHEVRTLLIDDQPWFVAMDVAQALEYTDAQAMTRKLDDDETQNRQIVGFGNRGVVLINESGMFSAILRSRKPEAKRFKKWVTAEVLPAIRKHGHYRDTENKMETLLGQTIGTNGFNMLGTIIKGKVAPLDSGLRRSATAKLWSQLHTAFGVRAAEDIPADQLDNARNFIAAYAIEGEYLAATEKVNELDQEQQKAIEFAQVMSRVACHRWHELDALTERHKKLLARSEQMMQQQQELLAEQHQIQQHIHAVRSNLYDPIFEGGHYLFKFTGPLQSPDKVKQFVTMQNKARGLH